MYFTKDYLLRPLMKKSEMTKCFLESFHDLIYYIVGIVHLYVYFRKI